MTEYDEFYMGEEIVTNLGERGIILGVYKGKCSVLQKEFPFPKLYSLTDVKKTGKFYPQVNELMWKFLNED